jgi:hypothetical protein
MIAELRGAFFLLLSLALFLIIIWALALGTMMRPLRWSERPGPAR